ncbi:MAG: cytochrome d ubiquinol oxidase subunit II [Deltaproteobacteria bacterium HGW-Deltaproteobacteria-2]|jgi:cytochrome d ubiquinol oxidase subunit II|nr:MAG: cytochrome d ubiquinol oxidase subunit II [Deltaproteobacteria bacterium HGW-Deltaproteobacteria-2]
MEYLQITWFALWGLLWAVYFMLDGFVLGTGILHNFIGKNDNEKKVIVNTVGPVWNGNEVWLITAGGATFAAFPTTYALMFSYLYTALLLLLFALIIRGVSFEFRGKSNGLLWKSLWDKGILAGSFLPALLFGVAFGNIFKGLPMDAGGYHGNLLSLLNPYGLVTGALFVCLFLMHGALYLSLKTTGDIRERAKNIVPPIWCVLLVVAVVFLVYTYYATRLFDNYFSSPVLFAFPLVAVAGLWGIIVFYAKGYLFRSFMSSCVTIVFVCFTGVAGLFPNLIPSSMDVQYSMTIYNSSSSFLTLAIMTVVALIFVPIVIAYKIWVYRLFSKPVTINEVLEDTESY